MAAILGGARRFFAAEGGPRCTASRAIHGARAMNRDPGAGAFPASPPRYRHKTSVFADPRDAV